MIKASSKKHSLLFNLQTFGFARTASSAGSLKKSQIPTDRFMNRSQWMANKFKDGGHNTYDWIPEVMVSIDPAPQYLNPPKSDIRGTHGWYEKHLFAEAQEKVKNGEISKKQMQERSEHGRLYAHLKHIDMRNHIRKIRKQEGTFVEVLTED